MIQAKLQTSLSFCSGNCISSKPASVQMRLSNIGISLFTYILTVQLPVRKGQYGRTGRNTLQPWVNNSLTLNLIVCQKRQLNPGRISLLKRKAQHRRKRIQRKKHGKVITQRSPVNSAGLLSSQVSAHYVFQLRFKCTYIPSSPALVGVVTNKGFHRVTDLMQE